MANIVKFQFDQRVWSNDFGMQTFRDMVEATSHIEAMEKWLALGRINGIDPDRLRELTIRAITSDSEYSPSRSFRVITGS